MRKDIMLILKTLQPALLWYSIGKNLYVTSVIQYYKGYRRGFSPGLENWHLSSEALVEGGLGPFPSMVIGA